LQGRQLDVYSSVVLFQPPLIATLATQLFDGRLDLWDVVLAVDAFPDDYVDVSHAFLTSFQQLPVQDRNHLFDTLSVQIDLIRLYLARVVVLVEYEL